MYTVERLKRILQKGMTAMEKTILFQGDSVTDAGRTSDNSELGGGYPLLVSNMLKEGGSASVVLNRAISGNRTIDLVNRWDRDTIDLRPDVLSVLIGVNDCWRKFDQNDETPIEKIRENYDNILSRTVKALPDIRIIILEPFLLPIPEDRVGWRSTLDPIIQVSREMALKYRAKYIPLDGMLNAVGIESDYEKYCPDGVHPTPLGHQLIAQEWIKAYQRL